MIDFLVLQSECATLGVAVPSELAERFESYATLLTQWNEKVNLTAIIKPEEIVTKHFADSLSLLPFVRLEEGDKVIDVGTGAGFPGVPLKLLRADLRLTLLDGLNKRVKFLQELSERLQQPENQCVHLRAEDAGQLPEFREQYALVTARAVSHLRELSEYCLPFVKVGGQFVAMKGGEVETEVTESLAAIHTLGGELEASHRLTLADGSARTLLVIKKISQTPPKYPRSHGKMRKEPLL